MMAKRNAPFDRPLKFGNRDQITAINAMNTVGLYCPICWETEDADSDWRAGEERPWCERGKLRRGLKARKAEAG